MFCQVFNLLFIVHFVVSLLPWQYFILLDLVGIGLINSADCDWTRTIVDDCIGSHFVFNILGGTRSILFALFLFFRTHSHQRVFFDSSLLSWYCLTQLKLLFLLNFHLGVGRVHQGHELVLWPCQDLKQLSGEVNIEVVFEGDQIKNLTFKVLEDVLDFSLFNERLPFTQSCIVVTQHELECGLATFLSKFFFQLIA